MAVNIHIKLADIKGESTHKGFEEQIDVLSYSWGASQASTFGYGGGGGGSGKANVQDLAFTKRVDKSSPILFGRMVQGEHIKDAVLTVQKSGGKEPLSFVTITITDVMVTSLQMSVSEGDEKGTEHVTLAYGKVKYSYQEQSQTGAKKGGAVEQEYSITQNK